jgi:hypothetical protein
LSPKGLVLLPPFPIPDEPGETARRLFIEAEGFGNLTGSGLAAIGDDVGGHGCPELAIALIDILDRLFALVARSRTQRDQLP